MPPLPRFLPAATLAFLSACAASTNLAPDLARWVAEAPEDMPTRIWIAGDRIVRAATAVGPGTVPAAVRTAADAIAPSGELRFQGREWGPLGEGFRIEKHYAGAAPEHSRSVLVAADGRILERSHTTPIAQVPRDILATALRQGAQIETAWIVSDATRERHWQCIVRNRIGHTLIVTVDLGGRLLHVARRVGAQIDV